MNIPDPGRASKAVENVVASASPFDAIRNLTPEGREYWSARDLMPLLGYDRWENFAQAIDRAKIAAEVQGHVVATLFRGVTKKGAGRPQQDFELVRFACYLTAMSGDPRKPEVAAALAYFAIRTREAETAAPVALPGPRALAQMVIEAEDRADAEAARADKAERKVEVEQRHRRAIEAGDGIHLTDFGKKYFSEVPARKFDDHLYSHGWLINQRNTRVRSDGEICDGYDHRKPTAKGRPFIYDHDRGNHGGRRRFQPRVRPQREIELRDALAAEGLPVNTHSTGLVLITNDELKGLGA